MQYRLRHPSFVASRHLLPRSGRRLKVCAIRLFVQRMIFITIIQLVKEEYFYINNFALVIEFLQTISINYSYLTNKRFYPKRCSLKRKKERTN